MQSGWMRKANAHSHALWTMPVWGALRLFAGLLLGLATLAGCVSPRIVSPYDEAIDQGMADVAEQLSTHMKNMAELGGQPAGTYAATLTVYNNLDAKLDYLIARASDASDAKACALQDKVLARVKVAMRDALPAELKAAPEANGEQASACNARLLVLVKQQIANIREIHRDLDRCGPEKVSCLRPATVQDALPIALQTIHAVAVVEAAKKAM